MKIKVAALAIGMVAAMFAAPGTANAAVRPDTGFCSYNYAIWWTGSSVNFSGGDDCGVPVYVQLYRILPNGTRQFAAFGSPEAIYTCQGSAINTYQSAGTLNGEVFTVANVPCG